MYDGSNLSECSLEPVYKPKTKAKHLPLGVWQLVDHGSKS
jgi:hypothetical protein